MRKNLKRKRRRRRKKNLKGKRLKLPRSKEELAQLIDHTLLKPNATVDELINAVTFAHENRCRGVCIPPFFVRRAREILDKLDSRVKLVTVIGFPLGFQTIETKLCEIRNCKLEGADEFDVVMNINLLKSKMYDKALEELKQIVKAAHPKPVKIIVETGYLTKEELVTVSELVIKSGASFIKTCTGFGPRGVTIEDVKTIKGVVKNKIKIKASGGISNAKQALQLLRYGADILGASRTQKILETFSSNLLDTLE